MSRGHRQNLWGPSREHDTSLAAFCESMSRTRIQRRCPRRAGVFRRQTGFSKQELATPKSLATRRVALVVRSGMSCQTLEDSLRSPDSSGFPRSLPTRRWSTVLPFFPSALICCAGRMEKCLCCSFGDTHLPPPTVFPPPAPAQQSEGRTGDEPRLATSVSEGARTGSACQAVVSAANAWRAETGRTTGVTRPDNRPPQNQWMQPGSRKRSDCRYRNQCA